MSTILITGGTGFIGRHLIPVLVSSGHQVRTLIRPSPASPNLPKGIPVEAVVAGFDDARGLRAAMVGVDTVIHLAGAEWKGAYASLMNVDIEGTRSVASVAASAGVHRLVYLSHLGSDRASAYPVMKAKAIAEEHIRRSGVDFTIFRSSVVFGPQDGFTTGLGFITKFLPGVFLMPDGGTTLLQPIWIEDLVTCIAWALEDPKTRNQQYEVGGGEYLSMSQIVEIVQEVLHSRRVSISIASPYLRGLTVFLESLFPKFPLSVYWLDYLAANRTTNIDTLPRTFQIIPQRFSPSNLGYLREINWRRVFLDGISLRGFFQRRFNR